MKIIKGILETCAEAVISSGSSISSVVSSVLLYDFLKAKGVDVVLKGAEEFTLLASGIKTPLDKYLLPSSQAARLIAALEGASDSDFLRMLDLVAISIIGDDVSLKGDERLILKFALAELNKRKRLFLMHLRLSAPSLAACSCDPTLQFVVIATTPCCLTLVR